MAPGESLYRVVYTNGSYQDIPFLVPPVVGDNIVSVTLVDTPPVWTPLAQIPIVAPRANTSRYLRVWEFAAMTNWPLPKISYHVEDELEWTSDGEFISGVDAAEVAITPTGLQVFFPETQYLYVNPQVTTAGWRASAAGIAVVSRLQAVLQQYATNRGYAEILDGVPLPLPDPAAIAEIEIVAVRQGDTRRFLRIWEFKAIKRWPREEIYYCIEDETEWADTGELVNEAASKEVARIVITDQLHMTIFEDGTELVDPEVSVATWGGSSAGNEIEAGILSITHIVRMAGGYTQV
jgi:hypothetical protein